MKSLIGRPNTDMAGDRPVSLSGVFRYCNIARWKASVSRLPLALVLFVISLLMVLTPISALQLLCGNATEDRLIDDVRPNFE